MGAAFIKFASGADDGENHSVTLYASLMTERSLTLNGGRGRP